MERKGRPLATIRATCPTCGDVELTSDQMQVLVCAADQAPSYSFRCPMCLLIVTKPTETQVVDVLVSSGVPLRTWEIPAEIHEPHRGPAITWDDLLEFHILLSEEGRLERTLGELAPGDRA